MNQPALNFLYDAASIGKRELDDRRLYHIVFLPDADSEFNKRIVAVSDHLTNEFRRNGEDVFYRLCNRPTDLARQQTAGSVDNKTANEIKQAISLGPDGSYAHITLAHCWATPQEAINIADDLKRSDASKITSVETKGLSVFSNLPKFRHNNLSGRNDGPATDGVVFWVYTNRTAELSEKQAAICDIVAQNVGGGNLVTKTGNKWDPHITTLVVENNPTVGQVRYTLSGNQAIPAGSVPGRVVVGLSAIDGQFRHPFLGGVRDIRMYKKALAPAFV